MAVVTRGLGGAEAVWISRATIERSQARIVTSGLRITRSMDRVRVAVRGGAAGEDTSEELRQRVRRFIVTLPKETPTVFAGASRTGENKCDLCGNVILLGASEYEVEFEALRILLDRKCFALWQTERTRT